LPSLIPPPHFSLISFLSSNHNSQKLWPSHCPFSRILHFHSEFFQGIFRSFFLSFSGGIPTIQGNSLAKKTYSIVFIYIIIASVCCIAFPLPNPLHFQFISPISTCCFVSFHGRLLQSPNGHFRRAKRQHEVQGLWQWGGRIGHALWILCHERRLHWFGKGIGHFGTILLTFFPVFFLLFGVCVICNCAARKPKFHGSEQREKKRKKPTVSRLVAAMAPPGFGRGKAAKEAAASANKEQEQTTKGAGTTNIPMLQANSTGRQVKIGQSGMH
jgi:hypothetical protein